VREDKGDSLKRIAFVTRIHAGREADAREAQLSVPVDVLQGAGVHTFETFIGSGYYITVFDCRNAGFQATFQRFFDEPSVQGFLDKLRPIDEGLPAREM
jgi:hypothetical protein